MTRRRDWAVVAALSLLGSSLIGCGPRGAQTIAEDAGPVTTTPDAGPPDTGPRPDLGPPRPTDLEITRLVPNAGSFQGGNRVIVRGAGFTQSTRITVGGNLVQDPDHRLIDARRLEIVVPPGEVGPADVVATDGARTFTLSGGYTYDALAVDPSSGATAGGTFIDILGRGTMFADGDSVVVGGALCSAVMVISPTRIRCRVPAGNVGAVDVEVRSGAGLPTVKAVGAFTYVDTSDPTFGGLGGGPIDGSIDVTVLNGYTREPVPGACVVMGATSPEGTATVTPEGGLTDSDGRITLSAPGLRGPQTVHIGKHCFESTSFVAMNARSVTVFLTPWIDLRCGSGTPGPGTGRFATPAQVSGELIWRGPNEYGPNPWSNVPEARRPGWKRVAYVYTTLQSLGSYNPDPQWTGAPLRPPLEPTIHRVTEEGLGRLGYPYRIMSRPGGLAVYALAGLEFVDAQGASSQFTPYVMGVARGVLSAAGTQAKSVDVVMDIPLDVSIDLRPLDLPAPVRVGRPDRFVGSASLDLGGEGVIRRMFGQNPLDEVVQRTAGRPITLASQPSLTGLLSDARYDVRVDWVTGQYRYPPQSTVYLRNLRNVNGGVDVRGFPGLPRAVAPESGANLPADRIVRWSADGVAVDLHIVEFDDQSGNPAWTLFVPGSQREAPIPDLRRAQACGVMGSDDIEPGTLKWSVRAIRIEGFSYDNVQYRFASNPAYWQAYSTDSFVAALY